ncbi:tail fiber protein [Azospirillum sp.]|uniref:phage tail protein n=1 Tax=Azospirillum sp. TaxID=34012 RepID=UPI0026066123|nr:tail fiber protein [Azospirillum sp.]
MTDSYLGEIRVFPFNWAPNDWALCAGQVMQIKQNQALFALLGTFYGGDGKNTFQLPDLRGRSPIGTGLGPEGISYQIGNKAGAETVTLTLAQTPSHSHAVAVSNQPGETNDNTNAFLAQVVPVLNQPVTMYTTATPTVALNGGTTITVAGGGQAHPNLQPYATLNFCIAIRGLFPARSDY